MLKIIIIVIVFIILLAVKTFNDPVQGRCLAVLVAAAMLWKHYHYTLQLY